MRLGIALLLSTVFHIGILLLPIPQEFVVIEGEEITDSLSITIIHHPNGANKGTGNGKHAGEEIKQFIKEVAPEIYAEEQKKPEECSF